MRNPSASRQSVGMGAPLDSIAILSYTTKRCSTDECNPQKSSPVIRKSNRNSLSCTWYRPELMLKRARVPAECTRGSVTKAAAAERGTTTATTATANRAARRAAAARSGRCTSSDCRTKRPSATARFSAKTEWWGAKAGRGRSGSRVRRQHGKGNRKPSLGGGGQARSRRYRREGSGTTWRSGSRQGGAWGGVARVHGRGGRRAH